MFNVLCKLFKDLQPAELASVTIGRGAFGRVFSTSLDNNDFAIKICPISPCSCRGERNSLSLRHPNIVKTHEIIELRPDDLSLFFTDSYLSNFNSVSLFKSIGLQMVIMEAAGSMSLETCINDPNEVIDRERRNYILYQISAGLAYCHDQRILHLDLKPSNIMISSDDTCKLVDFGCSLNLEPGHDHRGRIRCGGQPPPGTIPYTSPELFRGAKPTEKADIYSFGIIMWQLVSRETPFYGDSSQAIIFKVCRGVRPKFGESQASLEMSNYIRTAQCCWNADTSIRPSADELVHRFTSDSPDSGYESLTT